MAVGEREDCSQPVWEGSGWHPGMETAQWWLRVTRCMDGMVLVAEGKLDLHNPPPG